MCIRDGVIPSWALEARVEVAEEVSVDKVVPLRSTGVDLPERVADIRAER